MNLRLPPSLTTSTLLGSGSPWRRWRDRFEARRDRPLPELSALPRLDPELRTLLLQSLAIFQLGETSEGRIARQVDRSDLSGIDDDYRAAVKLFIAEEGRHSRILADVLRAMGGRPLRRSWREGLFRHARRLVGLRTKLLVLLAAEVVAVSFYGAIAEALPDGDLRATLAQIVDDESLHLAFHAEFFEGQVHKDAGHLETRLREGIFELAWWPVAGGACLTVALDHHETLAALGVNPLELIRDCHDHIAHTARLVLTPAPTRSAAAALG